MSDVLFAHPQGHVFYRSMGHARPAISHGSGVYLWDKRGRRYLDASGGPIVVNVGHGRQEVIAAMARQLETAAYVHATMFTADVIEAYAERLAGLVPLPGPRFFFLSSGSEVVEASLKLARQIQLARGFERRTVVLSRRQSYHGMTLGALAVSGRPGLRAPFLEMMVDTPHVSPPYPYRDPRTGAEYAAELEAAILGTGPDRVAAFIAEPISGASLGAAVPDDAYWPAVREVCDRYGVLLIADEVLVGLGRTGRMWALDHWGVTPDILVSSKGTAGGYFPLGFVAARGEDVETLRLAHGDFSHGGTFSHHAVGAAAGLAVLDIFEREQLVARAAHMGALLEEQLRARLGDHPNVGEIRGRGLFLGVELVADRETKAPFPAERKIASAVHHKAFDDGLIVYYSQGCADGRQGDVVMFGPPLIVDEQHIAEMVDGLARAIEATLGA
ncbi:MAG: aminotransferase class III-fold pyridoxal phosphate-dependent enzyme [Deltaproteobacteria bacterium]|nr:MAG: aminotransferase class III-fold pyridoxal phosphate-dependent enzyme [Deltaproteobacteria bacterium]